MRLVRNAVDHLRRQVGHIRQSPRRAPTRAPAAGREAFAGSEVHRLPVGLLLAQMEGLDGNAGDEPAALDRMVELPLPGGKQMQSCSRRPEERQADEPERSLASLQAT